MELRNRAEIVSIQEIVSKLSCIRKIVHGHLIRFYQYAYGWSESAAWFRVHMDILFPGYINLSRQLMDNIDGWMSRLGDLDSGNCYRGARGLGKGTEISKTPLAQSDCPPG